MTVRISHSGGTGVIAPEYPLEPGMESKGLRILSQGVAGDSLIIATEGRQGMNYQLEVFSTFPVQATSGESIFAIGENRYRMSLDYPGDKTPGGYIGRIITLVPK